MNENQQNSTPEKSKLTIKQAQMIEALQQSLGIVSHAAEKTGIDRTLHYVWMKESPAYREAYEGISEIALDFVETAAMKLVKEGNPAMIIYVLKCKGRGRGYVEKQHITIEGGADLTTLSFRELYKLKYGSYPEDTESDSGT